ncbi:phosphoglycerate dehydrogenase [Myxococcota bacterium]|nr:phosphoglycerate dehydrogenase [Myxococcota bacterium]
MSTETLKVLVSDKLAKEGLAVFEKAGPRIQVDVKVGLKPAELLAIIGEYDALAVRSATTVTADVIKAGAKLKVIGRAGIGVDNIDVPAATARGIVVMNTPDGNTVTTAEHAIALMFALARKIPQATASMKAGAWEKSKFQGRELYGKTLGVVGLGNIGKIVADRARGLRMHVVAFDPFVTPDKAKELGVELVSIDELLTRADVVTLHVPLLDATRGIINAAALAKMKKGAFLVNAARGGLVDEAAVAEAVKSGKLGGAAFDVFVEEPPPANNPLIGVDNVILTPHLGASTDEAQVNVSIAVAEQIVDFLANGVVKAAVNAPSIARDQVATLGPWVRLAKKVGAFAGQIHDGGLRQVRMTFSGAATNVPARPIAASMLTGVLQTQVEGVNDVNAPVIAKERGLEVIEERNATATDLVGAVTLTLTGPEETTEVTGALFGAAEPRIVGVNGVRLEIIPEGHVLFTAHHDRPGMIGKIGTILGEREVNISGMALGLAKGGDGKAQAVLSIDRPVAPDVLAAIAKVDGIDEVRQLKL